MKLKSEKANTPKTSAKVWRPILEKLETKMAAACLRRDAYLNKVLDIELDYLDKEVPKPNSDAARAFVAQKLEALPDRKLVSMAIKPELVERLNEICSRKNIVRDAFFNRLLFLLAASPPVLDRILGLGDQWRLELLRKYGNDSFFENFFDPIEGDVNPFWAIRDWIGEPGEAELLDGWGIHAEFIAADCFKEIDLSGMNCYVADHKIPGHPEEITYRKQLDELLNL